MTIEYKKGDNSKSYRPFQTFGGAGDIWNEVSILYNSDGYDGVMYSV
ncbi:hypothetical protein THF5H11_70088 [Vibrio jasicida]|nr:hypothetical protein THF5H11_70088 [Vibrio jasicida]